jgi:hypothetical protein
MPLQVVPNGPFGGCTVQQLNQARLEFTASASGSFNSGQLSGASINGQSFQFAAPDQREYTRTEYWEHLKAAYCQLGITDYGTPASNRASISFRS